MKANFRIIVALILMGFMATGINSADAAPSKKVLTEGVDFSRQSMELGDYVTITTDTTVDILIKTGEKSINNVAIKPAALEVKYKVEGSNIRLIGVNPCKVAISINEDYAKPLFLFVNPPQPKEWSEVPTNTLRFKAGVTDIGSYQITKDNTTILLEEGAVVKGSFTGSGVKNVKILGYGIIDGRSAKRGVRMEKSSDILIDGPIIMSANGWTVSFFECNDIKVHGIKILSCEVFSDGVDLLAVKNAIIDNIFIRNEDDCVSIKTKKSSFSGNCENITVQNSTFWSGHRGNALEIGWETDAEYIRNIRFLNCDIIRKGTSQTKFKRAALSIHHSGNSTISDVCYRDIRIESVEENLIWVELVKMEKWGSGGGSIKNISYDNITYSRGAAAPIVFKCSLPGNITDIVFHNLNYLGRSIDSVEKPLFQLDGVDISFEP